MVLDRFRRYEALETANGGGSACESVNTSVYLHVPQPYLNILSNHLVKRSRTRIHALVSQSRIAHFMRFFNEEESPRFS